ncbi:hypothetical protein F480_05425 [Bibersteinia trehalosi Y31]|uniref:DUF5672 domain-containing protein n=1 Tax=Bibersteinia trehalosi Y31 TaxID=1261658 RepID=A0A179D018_BIBTR|nr:DUF5672 family protein [Bibersteinia trehalosi]OAQ14891.1 hypothetical protein F480_05425 [Bibersteinia trehalosi Y31]
MSGKTITIVSVTGHQDYAQGSIYAIARSYFELQKKLSNERLRCLLISPKKPNVCPDFIEWLECKPFSYLEYNYFIIYVLHQFIQTDFVLIVQNDGFVLNGKNWQDAFLDYDYIGAPLNTLFRYQDEHLIQAGQEFWERHFNNIPPTHFEVQNGGFSLRSKRLLTLPSELQLQWLVDSAKLSCNLPLELSPRTAMHNEDIYFCAVYRKLFEELGIKFAPSALAMAFAIESTLYHAKHQFEINTIFGTHTMGHFVLNDLNNVYMQKAIEMVDDNILSNRLAQVILLNGISITTPNTLMGNHHEKN